MRSFLLSARHAAMTTCSLLPPSSSDLVRRRFRALGFELPTAVLLRADKVID
jgi:hypothetical protein